MADNLLTHKMIARASADILEEESPFLMNVNRARQSEFASNQGGFNKGDYVDVKIPGTSKVFDGETFAEGGAAADYQERSVRLQLNIRKHMALDFTMKQRALEITEYKERILRPVMRQMSSWLEGEFIRRAVIATANTVGTAGTVPTSMKTYAQARGKMKKFLVPTGDWSMLISSDANIEMVDSTKQLFHSNEQIEKNYLTGAMGKAQGFSWYEHQAIPTITQGNQAAWTINGANQTGTALAIGGLTATNVIKAGTVFTIPTVFRVHPLTLAPTTELMQFTVTDDFTAAGTTGTINISPGIYFAPPNQNVTNAAANGATVTLFAAASSSTAYNLGFHKDAFTVATAPLDLIAGSEGYNASLPNGLNVRVMTFGNGLTDVNATRIDILAGFAAPRPEWASRIAQ